MSFSDAGAIMTTNKGRHIGPSCLRNPSRRCSNDWWTLAARAWVTPVPDLMVIFFFSAVAYERRPRRKELEDNTKIAELYDYGRSSN
jgi:hypothetical protein